MRFSVAIECIEYMGGRPGWVNADEPVRMQDPVAFLDVDTGAQNFNATSNPSAFKRVIGNPFGQAKPDLSILGINVGSDLVLTYDGQPVLVLNYFMVHPLLRNYGAAFWKYNNGRWNAWTHYRSILHPATMTPNQRTEAMLQIVSDDVFWQDLGSQVADFIDPKGLAIMAGIMALCALNPIGWFATVLAVVLGVNGILVDWMKLAPEWQKFQAYRNYSKDENELREGAKSLAIIETTVITEVLSMKVIDAAGHAVPIEKLKEAFFKKTRGDWEQAANQIKAANDGKVPEPQPKATPSEPEPKATSEKPPAPAEHEPPAATVKSTGEDPWVLIRSATETNPLVKPLKNGYVFKGWRDRNYLIKEVSGDLIWPKSLPKRRRLRAELQKISRGTNEHAGHLVAKEYGGQEEWYNLSIQNPNINTSAPKEVRGEFYCKNGGGDYRKCELEWADYLDQDWTIHVQIQDWFRIGEERPFERKVVATATPPNGGPKVTRPVNFGNFPSPNSRGELRNTRKK